MPGLDIMRMQKFCKQHPVLALMDAASQIEAGGEFVIYLKQTLAQSCYPQTISKTLSALYKGYTHWLIDKHMLESVDDTVGEEVVSERLYILGQFAFDECVRHKKITPTVFRKFVPESVEVENWSFGLLERDSASKKFIHRFKDAYIEIYLAAFFQVREIIRKLDSSKKSKLISSTLRESINQLPGTGDIWRVTFGLLSDDKTRHIQGQIMKGIVEQAKTLVTMSSFDITSLCIEAIYEAQNVGILTDQLDEFTLNQTVSFSNVRLAACRIPYSLTSLGYLVGATENIHAIHLANFGVNATNIGLFADALNLVSDNSLKVINLSYNNLGVDGMRRLQRFLVKANLLTHLDVSHCGIGDEGSHVLAELFMCFPLLYLRMSDDSITDEGMESIVANLHYCSGLEWLDLSMNLLTDTSAFMLAEELGALPRLRSLDLHDNAIREEGVIAISGQLKILHQESTEFDQGNDTRHSRKLTDKQRWTTKSLRKVNLSLNRIPVAGILRRTNYSPANAEEPRKKPLAQASVRLTSRMPLPPRKALSSGTLPRAGSFTKAHVQPQLHTQSLQDNREV